MKKKIRKLCVIYENNTAFITDFAMRYIFEYMTIT